MAADSLAFTDDAPAIEVRSKSAMPGLRGPPGLVIFDSISGCGSFARYNAAPAAILDDLCLNPGPAQEAGAVVTALDFYVRVWGANPRITVRLSFYETIEPVGSGAPLVVQHDMASRQYLVLEGTPANAAPGLYLVTGILSPFVLRDADLALEIAFVDDAGEILANGPMTTVFPANPCAATQPVVGSSAEVFWIDNDNGDLTGDGIRYEPSDPSTPGDQGDALAWAGATPADNVLAVRIRGVPNSPVVGACCMSAEPFGCTLTTAEDCAELGHLFIGLGEPCAPVFLCVPPPENDECEDARVISGFGTFAFDTRGASSQGPDDCLVGPPPFGISSDAWYRWPAPCAGTVRLATCGQSFGDDRVAVYTGSCAALAIIACDDDSCPFGSLQTWLEFEAAAGAEYLLRVGAYPGTPGGFGSLSLERADGDCPATCDADFNANGSVELADLFAFLSAWFAQEPRAWLFGGTPGVPAIFAFLGAWFAAGLGPC